MVILTTVLSAFEVTVAVLNDYTYMDGTMLVVPNPSLSKNGTNWLIRSGTGNAT